MDELRRSGAVAEADEADPKPILNGTRSHWQVVRHPHPMMSPSHLPRLG